VRLVSVVNHSGGSLDATFTADEHNRPQFFVFIFAKYDRLKRMPLKNIDLKEPSPLSSESLQTPLAHKCRDVTRISTAGNRLTSVQRPLLRQITCKRLELALVVLMKLSIASATDCCDRPLTMTVAASAQACGDARPIPLVSPT